MKPLSLVSKIFLFLIGGIILGLFCGQFGVSEPIIILITFREIFSQILSFFIPLIIIGLIVPGIANLGRLSGKGLVLTTFISYSSTLAAGFIAYLMGKLVLPMFVSPHAALSGSGVELAPIFTLEIPPLMNIMSALMFAFMLGIGISTLKESTLLKISQEFSDIMMKVISQVIIPIVPFYVGAIFANIAFQGYIFETLTSFALVYLILFTLQIVYLSILYIIAGCAKRKTPLSLMKTMLPAYFTAMGTQSSAATIPVTLECVRANDVSEEVSEFVIPLGANIHLAGDTIALVITSMAIMYLNGDMPTLDRYLPFILMLGLTMIAAPGVPGGGVMAALGLLQSILGFGSVEKPLMIALHAAQDSFGTATNVAGDGAIAVIVESALKRFRKTKS